MSDYISWHSVEDAAEKEALESDLPGYYEGPADAYRHMIGVAELRRRFGFDIAFAIAHGNEILGFHRRRLRRGPRDIDGPAREMDEHNNEIGLEIGATVPAMAPREDRFGGGRRSPVEDGARGGGGGFRPPGATRPSQAPASPPVSRRSQELVDMVAPKGRPVGEKKGYAREFVRTLPGGRPAAEQFLKRLTEGRNPVDITPRGYPGRLYRLDDWQRDRLPSFFSKRRAINRR